MIGELRCCETDIAFTRVGEQATCASCGTTYQLKPDGRGLKFSVIGRKGENMKNFLVKTTYATLGGAGVVGLNALNWIPDAPPGPAAPTLDTVIQVLAVAIATGLVAVAKRWLGKWLAKS